MKLTVIQMALGVLVVLSACYIVGWMIFGIPSLLTMPVPDESGIMSYTDIVPKNELLFTTARYASGLLLGLSLTALVVGTAQFVKAREIMLPVVIFGLGFWYNRSSRRGRSAE